VDLDLTDIHRTVAFARGPGTSAGEPAQLFQAGSDPAIPAAESDTTAASTRAPAVPPPPITLHPGVRQALADLTRLGVVAEYGEYRPGLLILVLGDGYGRCVISGGCTRRMVPICSTGSRRSSSSG
jgi:hypothetical protein